VGSLSLPVPPLARTLKLEAAPREKALAPGGSTAVEVSLKDAAGKPVVGGQVAVVVVDESVLALTGYKLIDPMDVFYVAAGAGVSEYHGRAAVVLSDPQALQQRYLHDNAVYKMKESYNGAPAGR